VAVFAKGQQPPRATFVPFATVEEALTKSRGESPFTLSLDGTWRFHWAPTPEAAPALFFETSFDDSRWSTIAVPSNWEQEGFAFATSTSLSLPLLPPPDDNPVGRTATFTLPTRGRPTVPLHWRRSIGLHRLGERSRVGTRARSSPPS
jgi:hypothetical protein